MMFIVQGLVVYIRATSKGVVMRNVKTKNVCQYGLEVWNVDRV
jgi:hypothetical protein